MNDPLDVFLCDGSPCSNDVTHYQNLPNHIASRFPMRGTKNLLSSSKPNMLYLLRPMVAYHVQEAPLNVTKPPNNWIDTGHFGEYLAAGVFARIYKRILPPGLHKVGAIYKLFCSPSQVERIM